MLSNLTEQQTKLLVHTSESLSNGYMTVGEWLKSMPDETLSYLYQLLTSDLDQTDYAFIKCIIQSVVIGEGLPHDVDLSEASINLTKHAAIVMASRVATRYKPDYSQMTLVDM